MSRYHSRRERRSRLNQQENKRLLHQTFLLLASGILLLVLIIFVGLPLLFKLTVYLGDLRSSSGPIQLEDTIPPATPQLSTLPSATASAALDISGFAEADSTITLYRNGEVYGSGQTDTNGEFVIPDISLRSGLNRFYVIASDANNNESLPSTTQTVVNDSDVPELSVNTPQDGQQFYGQSEQIIEVTGTADPDVSILLNDRLLVVNTDGSFSGRYVLQEGDNLLTITATDPAGNTAQESLTVRFSP